MKRKVLILFTTLFISNIEISAQLNTTIVGDAVDQGGNCFLITNDLQSQQGGVWYDNPIDFSNDFTINYQNNFGDNDSNGADGMALVFKTTPNAVYGGAGGGIGYFSIDDSLIVEFDTFQNPAYLDPTQDHLSIMKNGNPSHNNTETNSSRSTVPRVQGQNIETTRPTVAVNSEIICSGEIAKLTATPSPIGNYVYTWVVPAGAENPGDVQSFSTSIEGDYSVSIRKEDFLCNMDFEDNQIVAPGDYIIVSQESIPCWETTASDSRIEVWGDGFSGISAYSGNQFIELNANMQSTLFQDFEVIPGSSTQISFAHRGRSYNEEDIMEVEIGPVGGPYINLGAFSDGTDAWGNYSIDFSFPIGEITLYTIRFKSIYPNSSFGNFLDNISLSFSGDSSESATGNVSIITPNSSPTFIQVDPICSGGTLNDLPIISSNGIEGTWSPGINNIATTIYTFTPASGECAISSTQMTVVVNPIITPTFPQVAAICSGETLSDLPTESTNNIQGTWSPALNSTATTIYTFSPDASETCAENQSMTITVNPIITPTFTQVGAICAGETLSDLPTTSSNGVLGTWSPAINNMATITYAFSPDAGECSTSLVQMTIIVNSLVTPTFTQVGAICAGETLSDLPTTSANGVLGTWSPAMNSTATTTYTFIPDASETCAENQSMTITVNPIITPTFTQVGAVCAGETISNLPTTSANGVLGTWSPAINNIATTTYVFTPDMGECSTSLAQMTIIVNPIITPNFNQVGAICAGETLSDLPTTSANGVSGSWLPVMNNISTTTYIFTPDSGECSTGLVQMTVIVNPIITPNFNQVGAICAGEALSNLPTTSVNGVSGIWSPGMSNTATTAYTFTPDASETCAVSQSMTITVNPTITPIFYPVAAICEGELLTNLPTISMNGVSGSWLPLMNNTSTTTYVFTPDAGECSIGLVQMTIAVNPIITPIFTQVGAICVGETLSDLPTTSANGVLGTWSPAINNTATTTYTFTSDTSETCAVNQSMTITVNQTVIPVFDPVGAICEGELLTNLPTTSVNGVLGIWSPAMNNMATTTYIFTPDASEICAETTTLEIVVNEIINSNLDLRIVVNKLDYNQSVEVDVANAVGFYEYKLDGGLWQDSNLFENLIVGKHIVAAREKSGCSIESNIWFLLIDYPRFFTPNNDGVNDTWNIEGLESQPEAVITVFDRYGKTLAVFRANELGWNGVWNGKGILSNSYWFKVRYFEMEKRPKTVMSYFSLLR